MIDAEAGSLASDLVGEHKQIQVPSAKKDANKPKLFHSGNETEGRWLQYPIPLSVIAKTIGMKVRTAKKYLAVTGLIQKTPEGWTVRLDNINPTLALNLQKVSSEARLAGK